MGQERPQGKDLALEMERLYREYRAPMFRIALAILRDEGLAEDAVQQSFLKIFQKLIEQTAIKPDPSSLS